MGNSLDNRANWLIFWLHSLVAIIKEDQGTSWSLLIEAVKGKSTVIKFDEIYLSITAKNGKQLTVEIHEIEPVPTFAFYTKPNTIRGIIYGQYLLDKTINDGTVFIRATIEDLLNIHNLVLSILADAATQQKLLKLWLSFEEKWPVDPNETKSWILEEQLPKFGDFVNIREV